MRYLLSVRYLYQDDYVNSVFSKGRRVWGDQETPNLVYKMRVISDGSVPRL